MRTQSRGTNLQTIGGWLGRILRFDFTAFDEVRANAAATNAALALVFVSSILAGIGSWLWAVFSRQDIDAADVFFKSLVAGSILQTGVWLGWVYISYWVLVAAYHARVSFVELIRTMGFAFVPVSLTVFVFIGALAVPIGLVGFAGAVLLSNVAIQQTSDADAGEAMLANVAGFTLFCVVMGVLANVLQVDPFGGLAPGILFFELDL